MRAALRPVLAELAAPLGDGGGRLHDEQDLAPARPEPGERDPGDAVTESEARSGDGALVDGQLMAEGEFLDFEIEGGAEGSPEEAEQEGQEVGHGG